MSLPVVCSGRPPSQISWVGSGGENVTEVIWLGDGLHLKSALKIPGESLQRQGRGRAAGMAGMCLPMPMLSKCLPLSSKEMSFSGFL